MNPTHIKAAEDVVLNCLQKAESHYNRYFEIPVVTFKEMGVSAGMASRLRYQLYFSPTLFAENYDDFLANVVPHEVAHLLCDKLYPNAKQSHGPEFKGICRMLGCSPDTYHTYDVRSVVKGRIFTYTCGCMNHQFTALKHRRASVLGWKYTCKQCKNPLTLAKTGVE